MHCKLNFKIINNFKPKNNLYIDADCCIATYDYYKDNEILSYFQTRHANNFKLEYYLNIEDSSTISYESTLMKSTLMKISHLIKIFI